MIRGLLEPDEVDLLMRYLGNHATQTQMADQDDVAQTTVSYRLRRTVQKLADAGLPVKLPGKGRRPLVRDVAIDPMALGCLIGTGGSDGAGRPVLRWNKANKIDDDQDAREW